MNLENIFTIPTAFAQVTSKVTDVSSETGGELSNLIGNFIAALPFWFAALIVAFLSYFLAVLAQRSIENKFAEKGLEEEHKEVQIVAGRVSYFVVLIIGITTSLSLVGIDLKPIVAAGAFGLGFALQDIIMNLFSGMFILASKHYSIGDVIKMGSVVGRIQEIQTRATIIKAFDGTRVIVPNAELFKNVVISKTSNPYRKLSFIMGVDYSADLKQVMDLSLAVVKNIPWVLKKPRPKVIFYEWGDYSINFRINVWIDSKGGKLLKTKNRVMMDLSKAYNDSGLNIPYPIQTIQMEKAEEEDTSREEVAAKIKSIKAAMVAKREEEEKRKEQKIKDQIQSANSVPETAPQLPSAIQVTPNNSGTEWLKTAFQNNQNANTNSNIQEPEQIQPAPSEPELAVPDVKQQANIQDLPPTPPEQVLDYSNQNQQMPQAEAENKPAPPPKATQMNSQPTNPPTNLPDPQASA